MPTNGGTNDGQNYLSALSTEALENMLRNAMISEDDSDKALAFMDSIVDELGRRKADEPPMSADESYKEFMAEYAGKNSQYLDCAAENTISRQTAVASHRHRLSAVIKPVLIAAAMVAAIMASMIVTQAAGIDVFGSIARWTADIFGFGTSEEGETGSGNNDADGESASLFDELRNALSENGMPTEYIPTYWPEGYGEPTVRISNNHAMTYIICRFIEDSSEATITFSTSCIEGDFGINDAMQYNKDDLNPLIYKMGELTFYIMENTDDYFAVCNTGGIEIGIFGIPEKEELLNIIESIGA